MDDYPPGVAGLTSIPPLGRVHVVVVVIPADTQDLGHFSATVVPFDVQHEMNRIGDIVEDRRVGQLDTRLRHRRAAEVAGPAGAEVGSTGPEHVRECGEQRHDDERRGEGQRDVGSVEGGVPTTVPAGG